VANFTFRPLYKSHTLYVNYSIAPLFVHCQLIPTQKYAPHSPDLFLRLTHKCTEGAPLDPLSSSVLFTYMSFGRDPWRTVYFHAYGMCQRVRMRGSAIN